MSSIQESGSALASVIGSHPDDLAEWKSRLIRSDCPLAQFHAKFWGLSMAGEEQDWRDTHPPIPVAGGELGYGDGQVDEDGDENMDESERTILDDIIPGCYILDLGIEDLEYSRIWIRADYIRVYNYLEIHYNDCADRRSRAPGAILTGQPGIGEFVSIPYSRHSNESLARQECLDLLCLTPTPWGKETSYLVPRTILFFVCGRWRLRSPLRFQAVLLSGHRLDFG
jgi:hypothetical protein